MALSYETPDTGREVEEPGRADEQAHLSHSLHGKPVINTDNGEKIGELSDLLFDSGALRVAAIVISRGGLLSRETEMIRGSDISVWGKDVILARRTGEVLPSESDAWIRTAQVKGRSVVSQDGMRIGQISDVFVDSQGRLAAFELSQVFVEGPLKESKRIPAQAAASLGKDVLIVDPTRF